MDGSSASVDRSPVASDPAPADGAGGGTGCVPAARRARPSGGRRQFLLALVTLALGSLLTVLASSTLRELERHDLREDFESQANSFESEVVEGLSRFNELLGALSVTVSETGDPDPALWARILATMDLPRGYHGVTAVAACRLEGPPGDGQPCRVVMLTRYTEDARGLDAGSLVSDGALRSALTQAARRGLPTLSGVLDDPAGVPALPQRAVALVRPVHGERAELRGFVMATLEVAGLMAGGPVSQGGGLAIRVSDGAGTGGDVVLDRGALAGHRELLRTNAMAVYGRPWRMEFARAGDTDRDMTRASFLALPVGGFATLALTALVGGLGLDRFRAETRAEGALRRLAASQAQLELALSASDHGVWEYRRASGDIWLSPSSRAMLALPPEGETLSTAEFNRRVHADDVARLSMAVANYLGGGGRLREDVRLRVPSGRWGWFRVSGARLECQRGGEPRYGGSVTDISALKAEEERREQLLQYLERLFDAVPAPLAVKDKDLRIVRANGAYAQVNGRTRADLRGRQETAWLATRGDDPRAQVESELLARGGTLTREERLSPPFAEPRDYLVRRTRVVDPEGQPQLVKVLTDISELRHAERELQGHRDRLQEQVDLQTADLRRAKEAAEAASAAKSLFLANMSHELRTPMHAVLSYARLGSRRGRNEGDAKLSEYFERILTAGGRLLRLLDDLLDLSKLEAGRMVIDIRPEPLAPLVVEVIRELEGLARSRQVALTMDDGADGWMALGDAARLGQVLRNLLGNAIKFTPAGRSIRVQVRRASLPLGRRSEDMGPGQALEVGVSDEGVGIPAEELDTVFDKFIQSSRTRSGAGGTGLGLAICQEIVEAHRGLIWAENNAAGGADVVFRIPAQSTKARGAEE